MKKNIKIEFDRTIFDLSILDLIEKRIKDYKASEYYDNEYDLMIRLGSHDITDNCLSGFDFYYWRPWHDTYDFLGKLELALRLAISKIQECLEYHGFNIDRIFVKSDNQVENTEIGLVRTGLYDYSNKKKIL